ncbi:MAG: chemotaxis protein [Micavibrio aeruginosavorus]|uniref:Chemotaxis protein n=1 Tax=Micavibrio aeruginosavorus TaxID=349221 RepID=A0A2W4ZV29_9BACT|nr:MAG: chemotaxis protein [Micavibrio aeruginosavorus]
MAHTLGEQKVLFFGESKNHAIQKALNVVNRAAAGDFEARIMDISCGGDLAELLYAINDMIDRCDSYVRESQACMDHVSRNHYYRKIIETGMQGTFLNASRTVNKALESIQGKVTDFSAVTDIFERNVEEVVSYVANSAQKLSVSSEEMRKMAIETGTKSSLVSSAAAEASNNVQMVSAASEQLTASISEISVQVTRAAKVASDTIVVTEDVSGKVDNLQQAVAKISRAVELIEDIANQTNLLALNATIEAARAGDAGKGFAVVASEVKSLAQQTGKATEEVGLYVRDIQSAMDSAVVGIRAVTEKIQEIDCANTAVSAAVEEQSVATREIARNIEEASSGTEQVRQNITEVTGAVQQTGNTADGVNSSAKELSAQAEKLKQVVEEFLHNTRKVV